MNERDTESGLDYRGARYYDSEYGRFMGIDPLAGQFAGWSPYNYVFGRPTGLSDRGGMSPDDGSGGGMWTINGINFSFLNSVTITNDDHGLGENMYFEAAHKTGSFVWNFVKGVGVGYVDFHVGLVQGAWNSYAKPVEFAIRAKEGTLKCLPMKEVGHNLFSMTAAGQGKNFSDYFWTHTADESAYRAGHWVGQDVIPQVAMAGAGEALAAEAQVGKIEAQVGQKLETTVGDDLARIVESGGDEATGAGQTSSRIWEVGEYKDIRGVESGLDAHHVGQQAVMKRLVPGYDPATAPSILVPKVGHTIGSGVVSRSTSGINSVRQLVARDVRELRRVYGPRGIPNESIQQLINMNKAKYPGAFVK
jgi:RHS repeat-associated protein